MLKTLDWRENFPIQSIIRKPTISDLLDFDPLILTSYIIIGAAGIVTIGLAWTERKLAKKDDERAVLIQMLGTVILILGFLYGFVKYIIIKNPLWKFF